MTEPLLCHRCGHWGIKTSCDRHMNEKRLNEPCLLLDRVSEEEYLRRARLLGLARQESLF